MCKWMLVAVPALLAFGADPAGFVVWRSAELKGYEKSLAPKVDQIKYAGQALATFGSHKMSIGHREGSGQAELHEHDNDLFVVETGEATLIVGGTMPGSKSTGPGEHRAAAIEGGTKHRLTAGDIVHIPKNTPHQLLLDTGKQFTYFTLKVTEK